MATLEERTLEGFKITREGRGTYLVKSRTRPAIMYRVDIAYHEGLGHCECEDFLFRRLPRWKKVRAKFDHYRCKHIRAVRNHVMDQIIVWMCHKGEEE